LTSNVDHVVAELNQRISTQVNGALAWGMRSCNWVEIAAYDVFRPPDISVDLVKTAALQCYMRAKLVNWIKGS